MTQAPPPPPPDGGQPGQPPPFDPTNPYLGETPAQVTYAVVDTPQGQRLVMTFHTPSTTFTVLVNKQVGLNWVRMMQQQLDSMSSIQVVPANGMPHGQLGPNGLIKP